MRAVLSVEAGGPASLVIREIDIPQPGEGKLLVRVRACGVNFPDVLMIEDRYQFQPQRPFSPGGEVSGEVAAVGEGVAGFAVGDQVLGTLDCGGMAEFALMDAARAMHKPALMPDAEAAGFLLTYATSLHALEQRGKLAKGETLLVLGAAGGAGLSAVQLGAAMGARVVAAASSREKVDFAMANGASEGVVYPVGPMGKDAMKSLSEAFKQACGEHGAHLVYDAVGGDYAEPALRAIAWEGRYLVVGFTAGIPRIPLNLPLLKACQIIGVFYGAWRRRNLAEDRRNKQRLVDLYVAGRIRPQVSRIFPMEQAGEAISALAARTARGKIVVEVAT